MFAVNDDVDTVQQARGRPAVVGVAEHDLETGDTAVFLNVFEASALDDVSFEHGVSSFRREAADYVACPANGKSRGGQGRVAGGGGRDDTIAGDIESGDVPDTRVRRAD